MNDNNNDVNETSSSITMSLGILSLIALFIGISLSVFLDFGNKKTKIQLILSILAILAIYGANVGLIGFSTAHEHCLKGNINTGKIFISSLPTIFLCLFAFCLVIFAKGFFCDPFTNLLGKKWGLGLALGVNIMGASWSGAMITYFSILKDGCNPPVLGPGGTQQSS